MASGPGFVTWEAEDAFKPFRLHLQSVLPPAVGHAILHVSRLNVKATGYLCEAPRRVAFGTVADAGAELPFPTASLDVVSLTGPLPGSHALGDHLAAEARRVLKPDGIFVVETIEPHALGSGSGDADLSTLTSETVALQLQPFFTHVAQDDTAILVDVEATRAGESDDLEPLRAVSSLVTAGSAADPSAAAELHGVLLVAESLPRRGHHEDGTALVMETLQAVLAREHGFADDRRTFLRQIARADVTVHPLVSVKSVRPQEQPDSPATVAAVARLAARIVALQPRTVVGLAEDLRGLIDDAIALAGVRSTTRCVQRPHSEIAAHREAHERGLAAVFEEALGGALALG
jgi:SAM-dependent methyltransferase